jgi:hypothetical protein
MVGRLHMSSINIVEKFRDMQQSVFKSRALLSSCSFDPQKLKRWILGLIAEADTDRLGTPPVKCRMQFNFGTVLSCHTYVYLLVTSMTAC